MAESNLQWYEQWAESGRFAGTADSVFAAGFNALLMYREISMQLGQEISGLIYFDTATGKYGFTVGMIGPPPDESGNASTGSLDNLTTLYDAVPGRVLVGLFHTHPLTRNIPVLDHGDTSGDRVIGPFSGSRVDPDSTRGEGGLQRGEAARPYRGDVASFRNLVEKELQRRGGGPNYSPNLAVEMFAFVSTPDGHLERRS